MSWFISQPSSAVNSDAGRSTSPDLDRFNKAQQYYATLAHDPFTAPSRP
jgi:hypothetical protein